MICEECFYLETKQDLINTIKKEILGEFENV